MDISLYFLAKTGHLISLATWIGAMMTLPIILAAHSERKAPEKEKLLIGVEKTILRCIINPAMILTILFGIWLVVITGIGAPGSGGWIHAKIMVVVILAVNHMLIARSRRKLATGEVFLPKSTLQKLPFFTLILTAIIAYLVFYKPF